MAMISLQIPNDIGRMFKEIDIPGKRDATDHITLFYLGDEIDIKKVIKIIPVIFEAVNGMGPFSVSCNKITTFPMGKNGYPVIGEIKSPELIKLRNKLKKLFDKNKIKYDNKFPEYKPHLTLSYSEDEVDDIKLKNFDWKVSSISLYGGDVSDTRLFVNFPFSLEIKKKAELIADIMFRFCRE
ncbi:MAG: 2'-5' RNA ligase family protein [Thioploca sp.]|nr:2'-5' RNA ligase family protein [Thioploca sp.]